MRELALHILDIAENSTRAGASLVEIDVKESAGEDLLLIRISDNGRGVDEGIEPTDPFHTSKEGKKCGLGVPLFRQAAESCQGGLRMETSSSGTTVEARFELGHIDLMPMGDLGGTLSALVGGSPDIDFVLRCSLDEVEYVMDTRALREELDGLPLGMPQVLKYIKDNVNEGARRPNG